MEADNETLVKAIQNGEDRIEELYTANYGLIFWIAKRFSGLAELDDMIQEGFFGLYTAAKLYDNSKEAKFSTYATFWIKRAIKQYIEKNAAVSIPSYRKNQALHYDSIANAFLRDTGREPTERELSYLMDVPLKDVQKIKAAAEFRAVSLSAPIDEDGGELLDTIPDSSDAMQETEDRIFREELKAAVKIEVDKLPAQQADVLRQKYRDGKTFREIGKNSRSLHDKALRELRKPRHRKKLEHFADELMYSKAMKGVGARRFYLDWTSATEREALRDLNIYI